ncbi:hypothetical protein DM860_006075 [Cuscuta australis]|uniref:Uncharacterized protein n=1 Tax=Cuscuta australis TaxID=267555 RepID=A0A328DP01_9ASTE|nr:hypothetical protein DM860_006075 [Cuscuta australis]
MIWRIKWCSPVKERSAVRALRRKSSRQEVGRRVPQRVCGGARCPAVAAVAIMIVLALVVEHGGGQMPPQVMGQCIINCGQRAITCAVQCGAAAVLDSFGCVTGCGTDNINCVTGCLGGSFTPPASTTTSPAGV